MLEVIKNIVWSPVTVFNIGLLGLIILIKSRCYTIIKLPIIFGDTLFSVRKNRKAFSLMCTSLGGTIGVGNAIGVAGAIIEGGAGAVFWMAIAGLLGMAIKYTEVYLSLMFGGPIGYIEKGIGTKVMAYVYAFLCIGVSFGMGNMSQVKSALAAIEGTVPLHQCLIAFAFAIAFLHVAKGGLETIRRFSEYAIPFISLIYIVLLAIMLFKQRNNLRNVTDMIINGSGIFAGIKWALIKQGITGGFSKAIFSSESGLGSAGFTHTESNMTPHEQAKWGVVEVFVDSLICIMTALALLTYSQSLANVPEIFMTRGMFALSYGKTGEMFYSVSMLIFAFSSLICWYYNGSCAVKYICDKEHTKKLYRFAFTALIFFSAFLKDSTVLDISDIANAIMLTVNVSALWVLVFNNSLTF